MNSIVMHYKETYITFHSKKFFYEIEKTKERSVKTIGKNVKTFQTVVISFFRKYPVKYFS